jgi:DNA-binding XRE family transcriptional regulator
MDARRKKRLESRGWKVGTVEELFGLTAEDVRYIELRRALSENVREQRKKKRLTQSRLAKMLESSQSRVAKMEAGDPSVSLDLMIRSLLAMGSTRKDLARIIDAR